MAILQKALDYIVNIVTENEEVQQFPKDFVTTSMQWIRSWFLVDDPKMEAKLQDPKQPRKQKDTDRNEARRLARKSAVYAGIGRKISWIRTAKNTY